MVFVYKTLPFKTDDGVDSPYRISGFSERRKTVTRRFRRDRRRSTRDRRKSVRDGVIVNLSFKNNRRKGGDRRQVAKSRIRGGRPGPGPGVVV